MQASPQLPLRRQRRCSLIKLVQSLKVNFGLKYYTHNETIQQTLGSAHIRRRDPGAKVDFYTSPDSSRQDESNGVSDVAESRDLRALGLGRCSQEGFWRLFHQRRARWSAAPKRTVCIVPATLPGSCLWRAVHARRPFFDENAAAEMAAR